MAASSIAVSVSMGVMKPVLEKLSTLMGDEYKKIKGLRKVSFLRDELRAMDALLEKMDAADRLDSQAKEWRKDIIDMSYDIEDCIDVFMLRVGEDRCKVGILEKASGFLKTIMDRYRIANQIKKIKTRVIQTSQRRERYKLDVSSSTTIPVVVDPRLSALYEDSTALVGLENQKEELVRWIMDEEQQLKVMSIVGFGGLGKTTLANEVYRQVGGHFTCKALICVSQKPDIIKLLKRILLELGLQPRKKEELGLQKDFQEACCVEQDLVNALRKHLQDKRYLFIVDDLWEMETWGAIRCAFPQNNYCSRVMITTRNDKVAKRCCGNNGIIHHMKPLSDLDARKLFYARIFGSQDGCPCEFEEVSSAILKRCGGLPLAIITIAGILASQQTKLKEAWEYIQTTLATEVGSDIDYENMMYILDLSYKHLPRHLKACFLYLGTYPEDHEIVRVDLVRQWVAEGFASSSTGLNVWDVAESYFNELVNSSMIQPVYHTDGEDMMISHCRVHDMMLDLILRKCKEDNFLILVNHPHEVVAGQDKVIRRLTINMEGVGDDGSRLAMTNVIGNLSHLRSLTVLLREGSMWIPPLLEFKVVRVLFLDLDAMPVEIEMDIFGIINQMQLLRYLKVMSRVVISSKTPPTTQIKGLLLLETLDLSRLEWDSRSEPLDFVDLPRLSHLSVPWDTRLPRGIGEMKHLLTLCGFHLYYNSLESIVGLGELRALSELSLSLHYGSRKSTWMSALFTSLEKLDKLRSLEVECYPIVAHCVDGRKSLFPRSAEGRFERLHLTEWTFSIVPRWIGHLCNLKELFLGAKQITQDDIDIIGMLPSLVRLYLRIVHAPTTRIMIGGGGGGLFTLLKWFTFNCDGISSLTFEAGAMPRLMHLRLYFNIDDWDRAAPKGLQHLQSLLQIFVRRARCLSDWRCYARDKQADAADAVLIRSVFEDTVHVLPTHPVFTYHDTGYVLCRPDEPDDEL